MDMPPEDADWMQIDANRCNYWMPVRNALPFAFLLSLLTVPVLRVPPGPSSDLGKGPGRWAGNGIGLC